MKLSALKRIIREELESMMQSQSTDEWDQKKALDLPWEDAIPGEVPMKSGDSSCEKPVDAGPIPQALLIAKSVKFPELVTMHENEEEVEEVEETEDDLKEKVLKLERIVYKLARKKGKVHEETASNQKRKCEICGKEFTPTYGEYHRCPSCLAKQHSAAEKATGVQEGKKKVQTKRNKKV